MNTQIKTTSTVYSPVSPNRLFDKKSTSLCQHFIVLAIISFRSVGQFVYVEQDLVCGD